MYNLLHFIGVTYVGIGFVLGVLGLKDCIKGGSYKCKPGINPTANVIVNIVSTAVYLIVSCIGWPYIIWKCKPKAHKP